MILSHITGDKLSFVNGGSRADIRTIKFVSGGYHVCLHHQLDDKSSSLDPSPPGCGCDLRSAAHLERALQAPAELARLTDKDFHDVGASWSDFAYEANKPFWRA